MLIDLSVITLINGIVRRTCEKKKQRKRADVKKLFDRNEWKLTHQERRDLEAALCLHACLRTLEVHMADNDLDPDLQPGRNIWTAESRFGDQVGLKRKAQFLLGVLIQRCD